MKQLKSSFQLFTPFCDSFSTLTTHKCQQFASRCILIKLQLKCLSVWRLTAAPLYFLRSTHPSNLANYSIRHFCVTMTNDSTLDTLSAKITFPNPNWNSKQSQLNAFYLFSVSEFTAAPENILVSLPWSRMPQQKGGIRMDEFGSWFFGFHFKLLWEYV